MNGGGGGTNLYSAMSDVYETRQKPVTQRMINSGYVTELVFVISDGQLGESDVTQSNGVRNLLKDEVAPMQFIGLGIGDSAREQLGQVLGQKNCHDAAPLEVMVANFRKILLGAIQTQVGDKIKDKLKAAAQK
jgi:hypothetical protein